MLRVFVASLAMLWHGLSRMRAPLPSLASDAMGSERAVCAPRKDRQVIARTNLLRPYSLVHRCARWHSWRSEPGVLTTTDAGPGPGLRPVSRMSVLVCCAALALGGCNAFNPAFINLLDPTGSAGLSTIANSRGHVVITFANNADVDERVVAELVNAGLELSEAVKPRFRLRVRVTFADGSDQLIEFIDGSASLVDPTFSAQSEPDLNQNDLNTLVVVCDVARVEVVNPIEVFVPLTWNVFEFVEPTGLNEGFFRETREETPRFVALQVDDVDEDLNTLLQRNVGLRDAPAPVNNPLCGSVVAITVNGVLSVPFFAQGGGGPGYDVLDARAAASLGGRYEFAVTQR